MINDPKLNPSRTRPGLVPTPGGSEFALRRRGSLSRLRCFLGHGAEIPKGPLQMRWEHRWTAASGAWFAVLLALFLGGVDWRTAIMVAAIAFMLARSGDMLDDFDE